MAAMTLFVIAFYSFIFTSNFLASKRNHVKLSAENAQIIEKMKQKEATAQRNLLANPALFSALSFLLAAALLTGIYLDGRLLSRSRSGRPWPDNPLSVPEVRWGVGEVAGGFVFLLFAEACFFLFQLALRPLGFGGESAEIGMFIATLTRDIIVAAFVWMLIKARHGQGLRDLGLRFERIPHFIRAGLVGYVAVLPPLLLTFAVVGAVLNLFSVEAPPQNVVQTFLKDSTNVYLMPLTIFVALVAPALEELFFRGFAYAGLRKRFGTWGGAAIASAAFAALHMNAVAFLPIFLLGMFLTYLYESSGSLIPSITAHMLHNGIMVALTLGFKSLSA